MVSCYPIKKAPNQGAWSINGKSLGNDNEHIHPFLTKRIHRKRLESTYRFGLPKLQSSNEIYTINFEKFLILFFFIWVTRNGQ